MVHKIFPYLLMRVGQVRPCQAHQRFYYSLRLAWRVPSATYPRLPIQVVTFGCRLTKKVLSSALGWDHRSYSVIARTTVVLVRLTTLLGSSSSSNMDEFTSAAKLLLSEGLSIHTLWFCFKELQIEIHKQTCNYVLILMPHPIIIIF